MRTRILFSLLGGLPLLLLASSSLVPVRRAGVPTDDNGATCTLCHLPGTNTGGATGSVSTDIASYTPGNTQTIHVTIKDSHATRWGFELTARSLSDTTQEAGTFAPADSLVRVRCDDGTPTGSDAPCNGMREFAQPVNASATDPGAGFTFAVNWTPPAQDIGKIAFYVAAVAGNGDGTAAGDVTYTAVQEVPVIAACNNTKRPMLVHIVDAAAFTHNLASGGLWTIFGLDFETSNLKRTAGPGDFVNGGFPAELACIAVSVNGQVVPITYVQTDQINLQGPAVSGPVTVIVVSNAGKPNELRSDVGSATVQLVAPAFFTFNGKSIAAQFANTANVVADPSVVPAGRPANPGDIVTLYGTGFGPTNPVVAPGALASVISPVSNQVTVTIGGVTLAPQDVLYVGLSPGSISGLYQLNVRIPPSTPDGDIAVTASVSGIQTQSGATIPVKSAQ